jgi:hypothetical protein
MVLLLLVVDLTAAALAIAAAVFWFSSTLPEPDPEELIARHDAGAHANAERERVASIVGRRSKWAAGCAATSAIFFAFATILEARSMFQSLNLEESL